MIGLDSRSNISVFDERRLFRSYIPGTVLYNYNHPFSVLGESRREPQYVQTSLQFLQAYPTETPGMRKAKSFWLKTEKYRQNPEAREQIRSQYPEEVAALRKIIRLRHILVCDEATIAAHHPTDPRDPNSCIIPENFVNLEDYFLFEPEALTGVATQNALTYFIGTYKDNGQPWNISPEDLRTIQREHSDKVERLKELLWHRHLYKEEERTGSTGRVVPVFNQQPELGSQVAIIITLISAVATTIFAGRLSIFLCKWLQSHVQA